MNRKASHTKRVLIVDDSSVMRAMLCEVFSDQTGYAVVGSAKNAAEAVQMERDTRPDVIAIDLITPYIDGSQLLLMLDDRPSLIKVVLSSNTVASEQMSARLIKLGANAIFDKRDIAADPERFRQKIAGLLRNRAVGRSCHAVSAMNVIEATKRFSKPRDEQERIALLAKLGVANSDQDYCLDIVAGHLAAQTGYPFVAISLVGEQQVWVKSGVGVERTALPRDDSVCSQAICNAKPTIIPDLAAALATKDLPTIATDPYFRSYAGAPIVSKTGVTLGMMCMIDVRPRQPTAAAIKNLVEAAALAAKFIEDVPTRIRSAA